MVAIVAGVLLLAGAVGAVALLGSSDPDPVAADAGSPPDGADERSDRPDQLDGPDEPAEPAEPAEVPETMTALELAETYGDAVWLVEADGCGFESEGTAFAIDERTLVTNWHVTVNDAEPTLRARDGQADLDARVVGWSEQPDLAILEVDEDLPLTLDWAPAEELGEGQDLVALGYPVPAGDFTVTRATVMSFQTEGSVRQAIRTDGLLDKGNSGGPALTDDGRVAGVVTEMALSEGFQLVPLLYTHDHLEPTIEELLDERPGATADCAALGERPALPDGWDWGEGVPSETGDEPMTYGDDDGFDALWDACEGGDLAACDELYLESPLFSEYESFGGSCGERTPAYGTCELYGSDGELPTVPSGADTYGDDAELDALWDACAEGDMDACDELWVTSPFDSEYEAFGSTCGDREDESYGTCFLLELGAVPGEVPEDLLDLQELEESLDELLDELGGG